VVKLKLVGLLSIKRELFGEKDAFDACSCDQSK
jgi:hypothetical protein